MLPLCVSRAVKVKVFGCVVHNKENGCCRIFSAVSFAVVVCCRPKRWDETLVRPDLDYSSIFADETGSLPGVSIWQIENFYPYPVEEGASSVLQHASFCDDSLSWLR